MSTPTLGERLRELRIGDPYLRLRDAAAIAHVDHVRLSKFENDREKPTPYELADLTRAYNADEAELLDLWRGWKRSDPPDLTQSICSGRVLGSGDGSR